MHGVWSSSSYEPHLLSLPFALAPAAMLIVIAYTAVMRGSPRVRGFLLAHFIALLPYSSVVMLAPSITDPGVAEQMYRIAAASIPLAAATGTGFQLALIRRYRRLRWLVWLLVASALFWVFAIATTDLAVRGVQQTSGVWFPVAGPWAWIALVHTVLISLPGFVSLGRVALRSPPSDERRQQRATLVANFVTYGGLWDVALSYGIGVFPFGWLLSGTGSLLVVRALVVEDLLRVRTVDTTAPLLVTHFAGAVLLGWLSLAQLAPDLPWWVATATLVVSFVGVRTTIATVSLVNRGARGGEGPLERLLAQLVTRARTLTEPAAIAQLASDIVDLGIGTRPQLLLASEDDWGWTDDRGAPLDDVRSPDPLLVGALVEAPTGLVFADELDAIPADLRDVARRLFDAHDARALVLVRNADELLALLVITGQARQVRRRLAFVERVADRLAEALLHARMARRAAERAALAREVELAAMVQAELLPGRGPHVHGDVTVIGSWRPATRCAGDFWGVYPLANGCVLVAIGDVTGHGVASAMVTAAVAGACDVCARRDPAALDLAELAAALDAAVRRVGGGELAMTCFAAILDPVAHEIRFVSCGHTAPYLCRPTSAASHARPLAMAVELHALVARGNPLGTGVPGVPRVQHKPLQPGDLVVWYTDGVIEAQDPAGRPYGDRRLQQLLKRLDGGKLAPAHVHDLVQAGVAAHRSGRPLADDETVVVAQLAARPAQPAQEAS